MNKYILSLLFVLLAFIQVSPSEAASYSPSFNHVPPQLRAVVAKMLELPEARELLTQVTRDGPIGIVMQNDATGEFDALWDGDARLIKVNSYKHPNEGSWICSILFELHNASTNKYMLSLYQSAESNHVSKELWVEQMERMEHTNALKTCRLLEKGITLGIYPAEATWTIFNKFEDYYKLQQITGHSQWFATIYDQSNPYSNRQPFQGTISGLNSMTLEDKKDLQDYLVVKNNLESPNQQEALKSMAWLKSERTRLSECAFGMKHSGCYRAQEKQRLMRIVFN